MSQQVDAETMVSMIDDFHNWLDGRKQRRAALTREWRETPIEERYDLGGEA